MVYEQGLKESSFKRGKALTPEDQYADNHPPDSVEAQKELEDSLSNLARILNSFDKKPLMVLQWNSVFMMDFTTRIERTRRADNAYE
jgi:hypothetical protein